MNLSFQFASLAEFLDMGGYAFYVWLSYGSAAVALGLLIYNSACKRKSVLAEIAKKQARETRLRQHRSQTQ
ncbi:heme exporter protein CcmD [Ferrimonas marina]|uniref:Heme exporter protein D n=1 Tax=Ferrimonas marina TaxID=299255 RepID=A0A1M5ZRE3_9GAMM|nr:heme exporter protein CcmD [Ferrimonas marina]SHI26762.1 heme exporter protein D [Ferrimonas marina]